MRECTFDTFRCFNHECRCSHNDAPANMQMFIGVMRRSTFAIDLANTVGFH